MCLPDRSIARLVSVRGRQKDMSVGSINGDRLTQAPTPMRCEDGRPSAASTTAPRPSTPTVAAAERGREDSEVRSSASARLPTRAYISR